MKILVLGAGGIGGYFGVRLHEAGGDVGFLVRPARAALLQEKGLQVSSPRGDAHVFPRIVTDIEPGDQYDVIFLSCKAYDLASALDAIAPAVGAQSIIVPLLNGLFHLDVLDARFGRDAVQGGLAHLAVTLTPTGEIRHLNQSNRFVLGARSDQQSPWLEALARLLSHSSVEFQLSADIEQDMWDKFVFLSALAAATCTMRASVGDILATTAGPDFIQGLFLECTKVASAHQHAPNPDKIGSYLTQLTDPGSLLTASMLRDIERGGPTESDHILGDMIRRGESKGVNVPLLKLAYSHLEAYELRRSRDIARAAAAQQCSLLG